MTEKKSEELATKTSHKYMTVAVIILAVLLIIAIIGWGIAFINRPIPQITEEYPQANQTGQTNQSDIEPNTEEESDTTDNTTSSSVFYVNGSHFSYYSPIPGAAITATIDIEHPKDLQGDSFQDAVSKLHISGDGIESSKFKNTAFGGTANVNLTDLKTTSDNILKFSLNSDAKFTCKIIVTFTDFQSQIVSQKSDTFELDSSPTAQYIWLTLTTWLVAILVAILLITLFIRLFPMLISAYSTRKTADSKRKTRRKTSSPKLL